MATAFHRCIGAGLLLGVLALSGCATMNKEECQALDWRTLGYEDGTRGHPASRISQHRQACDDYGVTPDLDAYQKGRTQGLKEYCTPANGYRTGVQGGSYGAVCPVELEHTFLNAYQSGRYLYDLRRAVSGTESQLAARRAELERLQRGITANAVAAGSDNTAKEERVDAVLDAAKMAERVGQVKAQIRSLEEELVLRRQELNRYLADNPAPY